jgi:cytochrome c-type biogenesis protein CcmH
MFWIVAAGLTGLTCLALLEALGKRPAVSPVDHDRAFYEAQIKEIDRQESLALIGEAEAEAARTEAARRLLSSTGHLAANPGSELTRKWMAVAVLVVVPTVSLPIYLWNGAPDIPSFPLVSRTAEPVEEGKPVDLAKAVEQIEQHLARNPEDGRGHEVIAPVYLRLGRNDDAVRAYMMALKFLGPTAARHAALGEALATQANGLVTSEARQSFEAAAALDQDHVKTQFFLAMAAQQDGDSAKAKALLSRIQSKLPDGDLKAEITRQLQALAAVPAGGEAITSLPASEQGTAIRAMVERLAERLAGSGGTADEWARLVRALTVLGETERVQAIMAEARQKFGGEPEQMRAIEEAGKARP